ncbi:MAG TPA: cytochrome P450, partial [Burkholderiales bacterium]|nr:cytochrome P450 [Burkholderiales bacterium]
MRNPLAVVPRAAYEEDFVGGARAGRAFAWVTAPALIKTVLLDERDKYRKLSQIRLLGPLLGKGILTSEGAEWRWQRQASAPMFRHEDVLGFVPTFVRATEKLLEGWRSAGNTVRAIDRDMARVTFDVISATLLPSADETVGPAVERSVERFQKAGAWGQFFAMANLPQWLPRPGLVAGRQSVTELRGAVAQMMRERRALQSQPDDLMNRLMRARDPETGQQMNDEQLVDNLLTFYLAGHETTARALAWTLYLLARSPQWHSLLEEEIAAVTGGAPVAPEHIEQLTLVQQVLKESMRLYPPAPLIARQAIDDGELGGVPVRRGMSVVMPIYAIHRHTKRWDEPDAFDPSRFSPEREAAIERYQYLPFGAGPRICIGMAFAMIEATAMLATLLQHVRFSPVAGRDPHPVARVTLLPRGGVTLG